MRWTLKNQLWKPKTSLATVWKCLQNIPDHVGHQAVSSRQLVWQQKTRDGHKCWADDVARKVGDCWPNADAVGKRCQRLAEGCRMMWQWYQGLRCPVQWCTHYQTCLSADISYLHSDFLTNELHWNALHGVWTFLWCNLISIDWYCSGINKGGPRPFAFQFLLKVDIMTPANHQVSYLRL